MNAILREEPPPLSDSGRPIPPALERLVGHCLEKEPEDRFQSSRDLAFDIGALSTMTDAPKAGAAVPRRRWLRRVAAAGAAAALAGLLFWSGVRFGPALEEAGADVSPPDLPPRKRALGAFHARRKTVVYSAAWDGSPRRSSPYGRTRSSRRLSDSRRRWSYPSPLRGSSLILKEDVNLRSVIGMGTLAQLPLGGDAAEGSPPDVFAADWAPDGREMAVVRAVGGKEQLEFPIGRMPDGVALPPRSVRVSPDGALVATLEANQGAIRLVIFDRKGDKRTLTTLSSIQGYAWSPDAREILFVGARQRSRFARWTLLRPATSPDARGRLEPHPPRHLR